MKSQKKKKVLFEITDGKVSNDIILHIIHNICFITLSFYSSQILCKIYTDIFFTMLLFYIIAIIYIF